VVKPKESVRRAGFSQPVLPATANREEPLVSSDHALDAEYIEQRRETIEHPLFRLFVEFGRGSRRWFVVGVLSSTIARSLSLIPPVLLRVAIDPLFRDTTAFTLPYVPTAWLPETTAAQFLIGGRRDGGRDGRGGAARLRPPVHAQPLLPWVKHEVRTASHQRM
jgi:ATP-binding cassette subfamily B protein